MDLRLFSQPFPFEQHALVSHLTLHERAAWRNRAGSCRRSSTCSGRGRAGPTRGSWGGGRRSLRANCRSPRASDGAARPRRSCYVARTCHNGCALCLALLIVFVLVVVMVMMMMM